MPNTRQPTQRVLVVDDDEDVLRAVERLLRYSLRPIEVFTANCVSEAMCQLVAVEPDLVLSDIDCGPDIFDRDGFSIARELRELRPHVPVVLMSGVVTVDRVAVAAELGAAALLQKPCAELVPTLAQLLGRGIKCVA